MRAAVVAIILAALTACGQTPESATYGAEGVTIDVEIVDGEVTPDHEFVDVTVGEAVNLHVVSDVDEVIHVHSVPEHTFDIAAGDDKTFTFTIDIPGDVVVVAHLLNRAIVQLVAGP